MTPPVPECTCQEPEKPEVWPNGAIGAGGQYKAKSKVTLARDLQSVTSAISSPLKKFSFVFRQLQPSPAFTLRCVRDGVQAGPRNQAMSAEGTTPLVEPPLPRSQVVKSNRLQVLLYVVLTLVLTVANVWGGRALLKDTETLTFAVGAPNSEEAQFAGKLAAVLKNTHSRLRLKILPNSDNAKAVAQFDRREADLAILRTDAKLPQ